MSYFAIGQVNEIPKYKSSDIKLYNEIVKMDAKYFKAYNTCDMKTQADIYDEDLEFFHDKGGLSTSKSDILKSLKNNICGKVTRTLIKGSVEVYPIKDYGAVQIGYHKFFNKEEPNAKSIPSKFVVIWKNKNNSWKITKVISLHN
jgi:ketosteroid isomerase-like protein